MSPMRKLALAAALAVMPASVLAHHGWSSYEEDKLVTVTAPLETVSWGNPHGSATVKWKGKTWDVILAPVSRMTARGLSLSEIDKKQRVTLMGYVRRDGTAEMRIERIKVGKKTVELR